MVQLTVRSLCFRNRFPSCSGTVLADLKSQRLSRSHLQMWESCWLLLLRGTLTAEDESSETEQKGRKPTTFTCLFSKAELEDWAFYQTHLSQWFITAGQTWAGWTVLSKKNLFLTLSSSQCFWSSESIYVNDWIIHHHSCLQCDIRKAQTLLVKSYCNWKFLIRMGKYANTVREVC